MQGQHGVIQGSIVRIAVCVHHIQLAPEIVPKLAGTAGLQPVHSAIYSAHRVSALHCSRGERKQHLEPAGQDQTLH